MVNERPDVLKRYLIAYRQAMTYFHDAFADSNDKRRDGPHAEEVMETVAKALDQPLAQIKLGIPFFDPQGRLVEKDFVELSSWYAAQGMIKGKIDIDAIIDKRDAIMVPAK